MEPVIRAIIDDAFSDTVPLSITPTRTGNNKQTVVVELSDGQSVVAQYRALTHGSLAAESQITKLVGDQTSIPVPSVLAAAAVRGYSYVITRLVSGTNLHSEFESLPTQEQQTIATTLGAYLGTIHDTFSFDGFGELVATDSGVHVPDPVTDWQDWLTQYLKTGLDAFQPPLAELRDDIEITVLSKLDTLPTHPDPRFYPWDFRPGNVLIASPANPRITAVLDWGDPLAAHRELSLAKSEYLIADWYASPEDATELREAFHDGYRQTSTIPTGYFDRRRRLYRLVGIVRSAYDSHGKITRPRYPMTDSDTAAAFHRRHIETLL